MCICMNVLLKRIFFSFESLPTKKTSNTTGLPLPLPSRWEALLPQRKWGPAPGQRHLGDCRIPFPQATDPCANHHHSRGLSGWGVLKTSSIFSHSFLKKPHVLRMRPWKATPGLWWAFTLPSTGDYRDTPQPRGSSRIAFEYFNIWFHFRLCYVFKN